MLAEGAGSILEPHLSEIAHWRGHGALLDHNPRSDRGLHRTLFRTVLMWGMARLFARRSVLNHVCGDAWGAPLPSGRGVCRGVGPAIGAPVKPLGKPPARPEKTIQDALRTALLRGGWTIVDKTHGNCYQPGWPDLYCFHPVRGARWVEVKTPTGDLTPAQRARFACWTAAGLGVWVLDQSFDLSPLFKEPNWTNWLTTPQRDHYEARRALLCPDGPRHTDWKDWL